MKLFKDLSPEEELPYRQWARENYTPMSEIKGIWHPVVQDECVKMNADPAIQEKEMQPLVDMAKEMGIDVDRLSGK